MRPTENLTEEHRVIAVVLDCLERIAEEARATGRLDVLSARDALSFLRTFADKAHHAKEALLYAALESAGLRSCGGPTDLVGQEHYLGRGHVERMLHAVDAWEEGVANAAPRFAFEALEFLELARRHMADEDRVLFPVADRLLPPAVQERLAREFARTDGRFLGSETRARFLDLAAALALRWGVAAARPHHPAPLVACPDAQPA
jgi:hemerythrin-like domain-containing protein